MFVTTPHKHRDVAFGEPADFVALTKPSGRIAQAWGYASRAPSSLCFAAHSEVPDVIAQTTAMPSTAAAGNTWENARSATPAPASNTDTTMPIRPRTRDGFEATFVVVSIFGEGARAMPPLTAVHPVRRCTPWCSAPAIHHELARRPADTSLEFGSYPLPESLPLLLTGAAGRSGTCSASAVVVVTVDRRLVTATVLA
jgi:hypothetical protein